MGTIRVKTNPLKRADLDEFVECYRPGEAYSKREATFSDENPEGRWRAYDYEELDRRDRAKLDIFWLRDKSLDDSEDLPEPDELACEIADDLQAALDEFAETLDA